MVAKQCTVTFTLQWFPYIMYCNFYLTVVPIMYCNFYLTVVPIMYCNFYLTVVPIIYCNFYLTVVPIMYCNCDIYFVLIIFHINLLRRLIITGPFCHLYFVCILYFVQRCQKWLLILKNGARDERGNFSYCTAYCE